MIDMAGAHAAVKTRRRCRRLFVPLLLVALPGASEAPLEQDTLTIEGNRGLPKTLYIAPWKRLGAPLEGNAYESDPDREPVPVERDRLQRELELHREGYSLE